MIIIDQHYEIIYYDPIDDVDRIAKAARCCYKSKELMTYSEQCMFIDKLIHLNPDNPHLSPLEHSSLTVKFITNRGITHELVRHRLTSPNQESTRYCTYSHNRFDNQVTFIRDSHFDDDFEDWKEDCKDCERRYLKRLANGHTTDEARGVLNNDVKAEILITANYREWRHILKLRTSKEAHYQMQELMNPLKEYLASTLPCIFGDI